MKGHSEVDTTALFFRVANQLWPHRILCVLEAFGNVSHRQSPYKHSVRQATCYVWGLSHTALNQIGHADLVVEATVLRWTQPVYTTKKRKVMLVLSLLTQNQTFIR